MHMLFVTIFTEAFISFLVHSLLVCCSCCRRNRPEGSSVTDYNGFPNTEKFLSRLSSAGTLLVGTKRKTNKSISDSYIY